MTHPFILVLEKTLSLYKENNYLANSFNYPSIGNGYWREGVFDSNYFFFYTF